MRGHGGLHELRGTRVVFQVAFDSQAAGRRLMHQRRAICPHDPGTLVGQPPGDVLANALCGARHNRDLALEAAREGHAAARNFSA